MKDLLLNLLPSRISSHLFLVTVLPLLLIVVILTAYSITASLNSIEQQLKLRGEIIVNTTATSLELALFADDRAQQQQIALHTMSLPDVEFIRIENPDGEILVDLQERADIEFVVNDEASWYSLGYWYFRVPISLSRVDYFDNLTGLDAETRQSIDGSNELLGWVMVGISDKKATRQATETLINSIVISIIGFFAAVLLWMGISIRLNESLRQIMQTMRKLHDGDLDARVETKSSSGEILELLNGFNELADRMQISNDEMSNQIYLATAELNVTLNELQSRNTELNQAREDAESANHAKNMFLARMSHELRTPLTSIIGFARLVEELPEGRQRAEAVSVIQTASRLLLTAIDDILSYVKLQSGSLLLEAIPFNLVTCIDDVLTMLKDSAHDKNLGLESIIEPGIPQHYLGDQIRISQILTNLINNAIKFTAEGSVTLRLAVSSVDDKHSSLQFSIEDTGIGVSEEAQGKLFQPFMQADTSINRRFGGSGLGLQICKQLVEMMDGNISIESTLNKGTTVHFNLVLENVQVSGKEQQQAFEKVILQGLPSLSRQALYSLVSAHASQVQIIDTEKNLLKHLSHYTSQANLLILLVPNHLSDRDRIAARLSAIRRVSKLPILLISQKRVSLDAELLNVHHPVYYLQSPVTHQGLSSILPIISQGQPQNAAEQKTRLKPIKKKANKRVLLVEDNPLNRQFLSRFLSSRGIQSESATDGYAALEQLQKRNYDLVLMDLHLPEMDGRECTRRLRASSSINASIPVYALTADLVAETDKTLVQDGFNGVMMKPVDEVLLDTILNLDKNEDFVKASSIARSMQHETYEELMRLHKCVVSDLEDSQWISARHHVHQIMGLVGLNQLTSLQPLSRQLHQACLDTDRELAQVLLDEYLEILTNT